MQEHLACERRCRNILHVMGEMESDSTGNAEMDAAVDDMKDCGATAFCNGLEALIKDLGARSTVVRLHLCVRVFRHYACG